MRNLLAAITLLLTIACASAACPTKEEVLSAIKQLETQLVTGGSPGPGPGKVVRDFGMESKEVIISGIKQTIPWQYEPWRLDPEVEKKVRTVLFTAYMAGNIKSQIAAGNPDDDPYAGWLLALQAYRELKKQTPYSSPALDLLEQKRADGTLKEHAEAAKKAIPPPRPPRKTP